MEDDIDENSQSENESENKKMIDENAVPETSFSGSKST